MYKGVVGAVGLWEVPPAVKALILILKIFSNCGSSNFLGFMLHFFLSKKPRPKYIQVQGWFDHFDQRPSLWPWRLNICPSWDLNETKEIEKIMDKSDNKKGTQQQKASLSPEL
jgi:hypothetical protein